jgi:hypothetical protein
MHFQRSIIIVIAVVLATSIFAAAPKLISYQGKATDAAGNVVSDGSHAAIFQIYDRNNNQLWTESASVTTKGCSTITWAR